VGFRPVLGWAAIGACCITLFAYLVFRWVTASTFEPTPAGDVPAYTQVAANVWQIAQVIGVPIFIWFVVIRPYRRTGALTVDGVMCIAFITLWWQDTLCNSISVFETNSAAFINFGSWDNYIPGWTQPQGHLVVEPPLGSSGIMYLWCPLVCAMLGCKVINLVKNRYRRGHFAQLFASVVAIGIATGIGEIIVLRFGLWSYPGAHSGWTLFEDKYYQYPIYEGILFGLVGTAWAAVRYYKNDNGQTVVERGIDQVNVSHGKKQALRVLAMSGILNVSFLLLWELPTAHLAMSQREWPDSFQNLQHLTNSLCGTGSDRACPGPQIPMTKPNSLYINQDGRLVRPVQDGR
jgi:hypothetical protein